MNDNRFVGDIPFTWFFAEVVNVMDPDMLGHIQIRIKGFHDDFEDKDLPWAAPILPFFSASYQIPQNGELGHVGVSPTGILVGSFVCGFFADGPSAKVPVIMGTMPTIKQNDPKLHDVTVLAREQNQWEQIKKYTPATWSEWEPKTTYATKYPQNKVTRTVSGHVIEVDDTPKAERIHIYHKSGTYVEISADGRTVTRVTGNNHVTIDKDCNVRIKGNVNLQVDGNVTMKVSKNVNANVGGNYSMKIEGTYTVESGGTMTLIGGPDIQLNP